MRVAGDEGIQEKLDAEGLCILVLWWEALVVVKPGGDVEAVIILGGVDVQGR